MSFQCFVRKLVVFACMSELLICVIPSGHFALRRRFAPKVFAPGRRFAPETDSSMAVYIDYV